MVGKPQKLSKGQEDDVIRILRKRIFKWFSIGIMILTTITGMSLCGIKERVETNMEKLVTEQFKEQRIQKIVSQVAAERASALLDKQVNPEIDNFKTEIKKQLKDLNALVARTRELEAQSLAHEQSIQKVLTALQDSLKQSQDTHAMLSSVKTDIVEMQKYVSTIQFYQIEGGYKFPNPYRDEMANILDKLIAIAIPDPTERNKFVSELMDKGKLKGSGNNSVIMQ